jgi:nucleoside-diphosphate-sugar epimerase
MKQSGVKTLIHVSTVSVHGLAPIQGMPISKVSGYGRQFLPYDHYGRAKIKAERIVQEAHQSGTIEATILRPGWMYGPRDNNSYGRLADMQRRGLAIKIGNGQNRLALVYASNVARALWLALVNKSREYRAYLCAYDGHTTQNSYSESLAHATGRFRPPLSLPKGLLLRVITLHELLSILAGYRIPVLLSRYAVHLIGSEWRFDQTRIERELGYTPQVSYAEGFAQTDEWYRKLHSNR